MSVRRALQLALVVAAAIAPLAQAQPYSTATTVAIIHHDLERLNKPFAEIKVIGALSTQAKASRLRQGGDSADAFQLESRTTGARGDKPYEYTNTEIGFAPIPAASATLIGMLSATAVTPDISLASQQVNVSVDYVRIVDYPGRHSHRVLMAFSTTNRISVDEDAHYQQTFRANDGDAIGLRSLPIFKGLNVGAVGVVFLCRTVNVENPADKTFLNILESGVAKQGLELLKTAQPAIKPFTDIAIGITKMISERNDNIPVQEISMGLLLSNAPAQAKLAQGSYFAVQAPVGAMQWTDWEYDIPNGLIKNKNTHALLPYNYFVFSVTKSQ